jgi:hypothetical protein
MQRGRCWRLRRQLLANERSVRWWLAICARLGTSGRIGPAALVGQAKRPSRGGVRWARRLLSGAEARGAGACPRWTRQPGASGACWRCGCCVARGAGVAAVSARASRCGLRWSSEARCELLAWAGGGGLARGADERGLGDERGARLLSGGVACVVAIEAGRAASGGRAWLARGGGPGACQAVACVAAATCVRGLMKMVAWWRRSEEDQNEKLAERKYRPG